jgi:hypothetical protein
MSSTNVPKDIGSILDSDIREYYFTNRFGYLEEKLAAAAW